MRPLIEIARFFRPSFAGQATKLSAVARKHFSSSAKCTNTADGLRSVDVPEVLDSSQNISVTKAEPRDGQQGLYTKRLHRAWSADEIRTLKDAHDKCMKIHEIAALFPTRTLSAVHAQRRILMSSPRGLDARSYGISDQKEKRSTWQPAELELLQKLHEDGASLHKLRAHFPTRRPRSVHAALNYHVLKPARPLNRRRSWSQEETQRLTELALQGTDAHEVAKALGRTAASVWGMAWKIGLQFPSKASKFSTEENEQLRQMRSDGATFKTIAATLGRSNTAIVNQWNRIMPDHYHGTWSRRRPIHPHTQLSLDDYQTIRSLRDQAASWSSIGSLFPQYQLDSIKQDFWRFTKYELSATDMHTIQNLRQKGESWKAIAGTDDYPPSTGGGLQIAYDRTLRDKAEE